MTLPNPIDTAWYLSRHPEIRAKLFALESSGRGPEMLTEINNVSYMLQHGGAPRRELSRSAPRPIRPLGGGPTTAGGTQDPGTMSFQDYKRWRQEGGGKR